MPKLVTLEGLVNKDVLELLSKLQIDAEAGEIHGLVVVGCNKVGEVITANAGDMPLFQIVGALDNMKMRLQISSSELLQREIKEL